MFSSLPTCFGTPHTSPEPCAYVEPSMVTGIAQDIEFLLSTSPMIFSGEAVGFNILSGTLTILFAG